MSLLSQDREPFRLLSTQGMSDRDESDLFSFSGSVGPNGDNRREDVIRAQILLGNSGDFDLASLGAPTGWPGGELWRGIRRYQKRKGATADGLLLPLGPDGVDQNGVGETLAALRDDLGDKLSGYAVPTPQQVDAHYEARAKRLAAGDGAESGAPYSEIVVAGENGEAAHPYGIVAPQQDAVASRRGSAEGGQQLAYMRREDPLFDKRGLPLPPLGGSGIAPSPKPQATPPAPAQRVPAPGQHPLDADKARWNAPAPPSGLFQPVQNTAMENAAPADHDQARTPDPAQPEEDRQQADAATPEPKRGRIVIAEDGRQLHVPPLESWADELDKEKREFADSFHDRLAVEMLHHNGPRGSELTQHQLEIIADACTQAAVDMLPEFKVEHVAGTYSKEENRRLPEEQMWQYDENGNRLPDGFRRPDFSIRLARHVALMLRGNSYDSYADGRPKPREQSARGDIEAMSPNDPFVMIRKFKPGTSDDVVRAEADKVCREALTKVKGNLDKGGEWDRPKPERPAEYDGPANKREADQKQKRLNPQPRPRQSTLK